MELTILESPNELTELDTDVWVEACCGCGSTTNHGDALCRDCDDGHELLVAAA